MRNVFDQPIDLPYIDNDREAATALLTIFNVHGAGEIRSAGPPAELVTELAEIVSDIRGSWLAQAYAYVPHRTAAGTWLGELWRLMWPLGYFWRLELDPPNSPAGPFPEPEVGSRPAAGTGADFIYMAMRTIGLRFSDEEFREQFHVLVADLNRELSDGSEEDEGEGE